MKDNQHFITKAHLDKFVHPTSKDNVLYPYVKNEGALNPTGTKFLGSADHFYVQDDSGVTTNKLDEARKKSENFYFASGSSPGALWKCISDDTFLPDLGDKSVLAAISAFLRCGSPVQIHNTAMEALMFEQYDLFMRLDTEAAKEEYRKLYGDQADQTRHEYREAVWKGKARIDVGEKNRKQLGFQSFAMMEEFLWETFKRMGLTICTCHANSFFITSDNPVILTHPSQEHCPGLKDAEMWFPISHRKGLLWTWKTNNIGKTTFGHSETRSYNRKMIKWGRNEIYSPLPETWIETAIKEITYDPCYGHYGSLEQIAGSVKTDIVDLIAALGEGKKCDVLKLKTKSPKRFQKSGC